MKMVKSPPKGRKRCGKREIAISFFHSVFKRIVLQTHKTKGLFGKRFRKGLLKKKKRKKYGKR